MCRLFRSHALLLFLLFGVSYPLESVLTDSFTCSLYIHNLNLIAWFRCRIPHLNPRPSCHQRRLDASTPRPRATTLHTHYESLHGPTSQIQQPSLSFIPRRRSILSERLYDESKCPLDLPFQTSALSRILNHTLIQPSQIPISAS